MPNLLSSPENIISEDIVKTWIESQKSTDNQEPENQKTDIFSDFPELIKIRENIRNEFPNDFKQENFDIIWSEILNYLISNYPKEVHGYLKSFVNQVFIDTMNIDIKDFENIASKVFILNLRKLNLNNDNINLNNDNINKNLKNREKLAW